MTHFEEPPVDPLADTNPSIAIRAVQQNAGRGGWRRWAGLLSLLGAAGFTIATVLVLLLPADIPAPTPLPTDNDTMELTTAPSQTPLPDAPTQDTTVQQVDSPAPQPTLSSEAIGTLLQAPLENYGAPSGFTLFADRFNPFTIIPDRPRDEVVQYVAERGDTIDSIAQRFGLQSETIAWSNNRRYVGVLYPGDVVNVLPVDGVYHQVIGRFTIADIAAQYRVDPYAIIDSPYNNTFGVSPETVLESGTWLVIPGGQGEQIAWSAGVEVNDQGYVVSFATGQAGSCGTLNNPGGGTFWGNPMPNGTWVRGFTSYHTGIDIAAATNTPVYAANGGPVVYSGWNSWGYGNTVVLAHGPITTLYGHMDSVNVRCGQVVNTGDIIGFVGSTGNSSGPHLHFEIRFGGEPTDPSGTPGVGW